MRRPFRLLPVALALCIGAACLVPPAPAVAHELLPVALVDFLRTHPHVTQAELDQYLAQHPELTKGDTAYKARLIDSALAMQVGFLQNAAIFIRLGIGHILGGADHILFVLSLLLTFVTLRRMLKSITAFTVAHSITLLLAGSGALTLPSRVVEPMIALSIAVMAIGTVFFRHYKYFASTESKLSLIFLFGLFHGLGFAGLLKELAIPQNQFVPSLLFFNVGIEAGQLVIICAALPFILLFRRKHWYPRAIRVFAGGIGGIAILWFLQRVMGL